MARRAGYHWGTSACISFVAAIILALGLMAGGFGIRHASAASAGCAVINLTEMDQAFGFGGNPIGLYAGEIVSVTGSAPITGPPTQVLIIVDGSTVASSPFPGTASSVVPTTNVYTVSFKVDTGTALLDVNCIPNSPTPIPTTTATALATPSDTPATTSTVTNTPTDTPRRAHQHGDQRDDRHCHRAAEYRRWSDH